jgi:hypothetical protein
MVAPLPFFERLAPAMPAPGAVLPALPPRFAAIQAETPGSAAAAPDAGGEGETAPPAHPPVGFARRVETLSLPTADRAPPARPASQGSPIVTAPLPPSPAPVGSDRPAAASENVVVTAPALSAVPSGTGDRPAAGASRTAVATTPAEPLRADAEPAASRSAALAAGVIVPVPAAVPPLDARAPLREPVMRQRAVASAGFAPTEIQVTIDRIEVRAPAAATGGAARPAPTLHPAPALSLADYLRQGRPGRRSGGAG